jgi:hypothetical protein
VSSEEARALAGRGTKLEEVVPQDGSDLVRVEKPPGQGRGRRRRDEPDLGTGEYRQRMVTREAQAVVRAGGASLTYAP